MSVIVIVIRFFLFLLVFVEVVYSYRFSVIISKIGQDLEIGEVVIISNGSKVPNEKFFAYLSSLNKQNFFPANLCVNGNALDYCCAGANDTHPSLTIEIDTSVRTIDKVIVFNHVVKKSNRIRLNGAIIRIFDNSEQLLWQGDFGHSGSMKYIFDVDFAHCLSSGPKSTSCFNNIPEVAVQEAVSQVGQDEMAIEYFGGMRGGFFVDFGANDGTTFSNSYTLERSFGWNGITIEPLPRHYESLRRLRNCTILSMCASNASGFRQFRIVESNTFHVNIAGFDPDMFSGLVDPWIWHETTEFAHKSLNINVYCLRTQEIFDNFNVRHIDYMSVDAEGAELMILQGIEWDRMDITLINVDFTREIIAGFLGSRGYRMVKHGHDLLAIKGTVFGDVTTVFGYD